MNLITVSTPFGKPATDASKVIEAQLLGALNAGLSPMPIVDEALTSFTVALTTKTAKALSEVAQAHHLGDGIACAGLLLALRGYRGRSSSPVGAVAAPIASPRKPGAGRRAKPPEKHASKRALQTEKTEGACLLQLREILRPTAQSADALLQDGKIAFAQASTGTGKGRMIAYLALAARARLPEHETVLIASPLSVTRQLINEIRVLDSRVPIRLLLGRNNFVDPVLLAQWVEGVEARDKALVADLRAWMDAGGPPATEGTRTLAADLAQGKHLAWLMEDAVSLCEEELPVSELTLTDGAEPDNPGEQAYLATRHEPSTGPEITLCSHTMLAADTRLRYLSAQSGLLPESFGLLLVDEAHELERAFSSVFSQALHLATLPHLVSKAGLSGPQARAITQSAQSLISAVGVLGAAGRLPRVGTLGEIPEVFNETIALSGALGGLPKTKKSKESEKKGAKRALSRARALLAAACAGHATLHLSVSPVQQRPVLVCGQANLSRPLTALWERARAVLLTSATLYTPGASAEEPGAYRRAILHVPQTRARFLPAVRPSWVVDCVELHEDYSGLVPDDSTQWLLQTAYAVVQAHETAKGGTLVLCTSYQTVAALAQMLAAMLPDDCPLIEQSPYQRAAVCAQAMREAAARGERAVWLGVGAAWTGVDLSNASVPAKDDLVLTDLIIPRVPMGTNRTLSHLRRRAFRRDGFLLEAKECAMAFAQGIGRLVRREGVEHRRLWVLDARLGDRKLGYLSAIRNLLAEYRRR